MSYATDGRVKGGLRPMTLTLTRAAVVSSEAENLKGGALGKKMGAGNWRR